MTTLENRLFMDIVDVNNQYEGKWVLMAQEDRSKYFEDGYLIAYADDTDENYEKMLDMLEMELEDNGYVHYAHVDTGESFYVIFGEVVRKY